MNDIQDQINSLFQRLQSLDPKERLSILSSLKDSLECSEPQLLPSLAGSDDSSKEDTIPSLTESPQLEGVKVRTKLLPFQRKRFTLSSRKLVSRQEEIPSRYIGRTGLTLSCPVCGLKATTWQKFSHHLHTGHSSAVISVCRRCNGIFKTRALLLAHECFLWGRRNLPCSAVYSSIDQSSKFLKKFGFPNTGIYFERRCGLCPASNVTFSSYEQFERHKYEEHANSGSTPPLFDARRRKGLVFQGPPGQRLSRTLQNRFACSNRRTSLQRTPKPALKLNLATSVRMTMTQTATKELLFTSCDGRVAVDVQRVDQGRDPTEAHQPSTLPPVDSIEQTPEVPAYTDHVCQVCSASFTADTLLQENINSEHFPVEDGEARRTLSELDEKGPGGATTAISLSGTLDEEEEEETECTDKDTEAGQCAGTTTESQALKVVVCKLCRISFRNSEFLQRHERTSTQHAKKVKLLAKVRTRIRKSQVALGGLAVYCCTDCSLTYARKQSLDRHISVVHHREATFACEYCEFEASDRATFSEHMARHFHLKDVACEFCNHRCISKRELKDHILFKHQDERSYACPLCAKTFKTAGTLSRHRRTHTNISYTCELCSAKFNRQSNLTRHMRTVHTSDTRRRRGRKRAIRGTASPPVGPSPLLPIRPKCATATEVMIPAAVESQDGTFDAIIDCNALPPSDASVPVEVAGFVSIAQVGALPSDLSSPEVHQKAQPEPPDSIYFVSCSPTTMPSSSVNVSSTSLVNSRSFSVSFPSAEEHTSLDVDDDGQSRNVNVDAVARPLSVLAADQGGACPGILNSSPNEASFRRSDLHKTSESHIPSESGHLSVLPCVSDLFFSDASTIAERTITQSSFVDGNRDTVHVCFSSDLAPISSCSRPIWRPLDDLQHPQNSMPDTPSLTYSAFSDSVPTKPHECKPPHVICHDYLTFDGSPASTSAVAAATAVASAAFTTVTSAFPPICALTSPGGIITDATISATQLSSTCWQKSGLPNDLHYTLFQDSEHPAITSNFFVIPSGGLRVAKFSDMLPNLNSTPGGVAETMVDASADQSRNHTDFSVGYLIGGDGSGVDGGDGGGHDCDGAMTELHVTSHSTLTPSSSAFGPFFASSVLPSLPTSDCLSLIPITSNFDDLQNTTDFSYNGYLL